MKEPKSYLLSLHILSELSSTKFQPTYARQAFPCFDEPNLKATFKVIIEHDSKLGAISNMPKIDSQKIDESRNRTTFDTSNVKMSTYLVAFAISDFLYKYDHTKRGKEVRYQKEIIIFNFS